MTATITSRFSTATGRIKLGMVGGGQGAFIGAVHRMAARLDDRYELVAGALSADPTRALSSGQELGLARERIYSDYEVMAQAEAKRADGIEAVAIVTPNHLHVPIARAFIAQGIHVICDKPLALSLEEAQVLSLDLSHKPEVIFAVTYNYSGYPLIREAQHLVKSGALGDLRLIELEYIQDWLTEPVEATGQKQALWRTDPAKSGAGGALGDIGTHAYQLGHFVAGLEPQELAADLASFGAGRQLDDNAHIMLRYARGVKGMMWLSQVAPGQENGLRLRIYGSKGALSWEQENPNQLWVTRFGEPKQLITRGGAGTSLASQRVTRVPAGHPEGYLEGFATIYSEVGQAIIAKRQGLPLDPHVSFPGIDDGVAGMRFITAAVQSAAQNSAWVKLAEV